MERKPSHFGRLLLGTLVLASCIGCDQATKRFATTQLRGTPGRTYFSNTVRLEYAQNPGGFLSLGADLAPRPRFWFFTVTNAAMVSALATVMLKRWKMRLEAYVACSYLLAGSIGNMIDRVLHGGLVSDFIILDFGILHTGVFNVADVAITFGVLVIAVLHYLNRVNADLAATE